MEGGERERDGEKRKLARKSHIFEKRPIDTFTVGWSLSIK